MNTTRCLVLFTLLLAAALQACGGKVKFTLCAQTRHEASSQITYRQDELYEWLG